MHHRSRRKADAVAALLLTRQSNIGRAKLARAAGYTGSHEELTKVGKKIVERLVDKGGIRRVFSQQGYTLEKFVAQVIEQTEATTMTVIQDRKGHVIERLERPDWRARHMAREQYATLAGLNQLPLDSEQGRILGDIGDRELTLLFAKLGPGHPKEAAERRVEAEVTEQPAEVDTSKGPDHSLGVYASPDDLPGAVEKSQSFWADRSQPAGEVGSRGSDNGGGSHRARPTDVDEPALGCDGDRDGPAQIDLGSDHDLRQEPDEPAAGGLGESP